MAPAGNLWLRCGGRAQGADAAISTPGGHNEAVHHRVGVASQ